MIPDLKPVELCLRVSPALLRWVVIVHSLSAITILWLSTSFGLNALITLALLVIVCWGCVRCHHNNQLLDWSKISFDGNQWVLFSTNTVSDSPVLVKLDYHYRFGKNWILGFSQLEKRRKRITIPLLHDACDKKSLREMSHLLLASK